MKIKIIQELKPYTFTQMKELFELSEKDSKNVIEKLRLMSFLRKINKSSLIYDLEELIDFDYTSLNLDYDDNIYVFKYVGIISIGDICFFVYPKYIVDISSDVKNKYKKFRQILDVIRKYQSKNQNHDLIGNEDDLRFNLLSYTLDLIDSYNEHGLYSRDKSIIEINGDGEILWDRTINEESAYFNKNVPIYLDLITVNDITNENDIFRRIHSCILSECCTILEDLLEILCIEKIILTNEYISDVGSKDYLIYIIESESTKQFVTWKQKILEKMLEYINKDEIKNSIDNISFVGTNSFNLIWEDVCSVAMGNSLDKTMKQLNLKPTNGYVDSDLLKDVIPKPKWKHNASNKIHLAKKTLIPDLITVTNGSIYIYDAKYYNIILNEEKVAKNPGVGDLTKQYLYELAYNDLINLNKLEVKRNAFLMPSDSKEEIILGVASFEIFSVLEPENKLRDIEIILKPCERMYEIYLNN